MADPRAEFKGIWRGFFLQEGFKHTRDVSAEGPNTIPVDLEKNQ